MLTLGMIGSVVMDSITKGNSLCTKEKAEKVAENNSGKVLSPFAGRDIPTLGAPVVPTMSFMIQITPEFQKDYLEYVKKTGLDGGEVVKLLMTLGLVALKKIFDEENNNAPS